MLKKLRGGSMRVLGVGLFVLESEISGAVLLSCQSYGAEESQWQTQGRTREVHINAN